MQGSERVDGQVRVGADHAAQTPLRLGDRMDGHRRVGPRHARLYDDATLEPERGVDLKIMLDRGGWRRVAALLGERKEMGGIYVKVGVPTAGWRYKPRLAGIGVGRE